MFQFKEVAVQRVATWASIEAFTQTTQPGSGWSMHPPRRDHFLRQERFVGEQSKRANQAIMQLHPAPEQGRKEHDPALEATA